MTSTTDEDAILGLGDYNGDTPSTAAGGADDDEYNVDAASSSALPTAKVSGDPDLESMKAKLAEMEAEAAKLREIQAKAEKDLSTQSVASKADSDARSVFVGNVDFSSTPEEVQQHFQSCGAISRITIICDKFTGRPKGHAYVEFAEASSVASAMLMNDSLFKGRQLKVVSKRTNLPVWQLGRGGGGGGGGGAPRGGRGGGFRGRARGGFRARGSRFRPY